LQTKNIGACGKMGAWFSDMIRIYNLEYARPSSYITL